MVDDVKDYYKVLYNLIPYKLQDNLDYSTYLLEFYIVRNYNFDLSGEHVNVITIRIYFSFSLISN